MADVLHQLLRRSAQADPGRPAIQFKDETLSYGELDDRSDRLASCLAREGVRPGDRVGHHLDKSRDAVIGLFGILKAGAAYVPLDPLGPPERAGLILADCAIRHLVSSARKKGHLRHFLTRAVPLERVYVLDADDGPPLTEGLACRTLFKEEIFRDRAVAAVATTEHSLAYILYTSGSTGQPKGVMISHAASLAFVQWAAAAFALRPSDRVSSHAPFQFDLSIFDLFATIRAGACLCLVPQGLSVFPQSLAAWIEQQSITTWYSVPSILIQLLLHGELGTRDLRSLRQVLFAGEVFPGRHLRALMAQLPRARFFNLYGPTETNVCTWHPVPAPPEPGASLPIGLPCAGDRGYVVDEEDRLVPAGGQGELYISGPTLMSGYWGDPGKTGRVLKANPFDPRPGHEVVYRSGDLVRVRPDGNYEFHGRRDGLIKSRGYRIEAGEVEHALLQHPEIEEAVITAQPDAEIGNRLAAWIIRRPGRAVDEPAIKRFCAERLPAYMIPDVIHFRSELPRTATQKIDRSALTGGAV